MTTNVTVKTGIRFKGQEYASADDMPPDIRQAYERALASIGTWKQGGDFRSKSTTSRLVTAFVVVAAILMAAFVFGW